MIATVIAVSIGSVAIPFGKVVRIFATHLFGAAPGSASATESQIVWEFRLPRVGLLSQDTRGDAVIVAEALAQRPKLFVLDKPTNHLDIHHQLELFELIQSLGMTTLITLRDLNLAAAYCRRLYLLFEGHIVAAGTPEEVLTPALLRRVFKVEAVCGQYPASGAL